MKTTRFVLILLCCILVLPSLALGQSGGSIEVQQPNTDNYPQMSTLVSVLDGNGIPVPGLTPDAFEIVEDGRTSFPPSTVEERINPDAQVSMALAIDLSGTMQGQPIAAAQAASQSLLDTLFDKENDPDRVAFFGISRAVKPDDAAVDDRAAPEVPFGNDKNKVLNTINYLPPNPTTRPTPLWDSLLRMVKLTSAQSGRRAIIVITDGVDTVSVFKIEDVIGEANRANIPIFPIGLSRNKINAVALERLAARTGGVFRIAPSPEEFAGLFAQVLNQLKLEYQLAYQARVAQDANPHSLLVAARAPRIGRLFSEVKYSFNVTPVPEPSETPTAALTPSGPTATIEPPTPQPSPTPPPPQGIVDRIMTFISGNPLPAALIGIAALLLIVLLILVVVWARRRRQPQATEADFSGDWPSGGVSGPSNPVLNVNPTAPNVADASRTANASPGFGWPPTQMPGSPGGGAPMMPPPAPPAGHTVAIPRVKPPQHVAMLVDRKNPSRQFTLMQSTSVGRASENAISLPDNPTVSRSHARIWLDGDQYKVHDLDSANGTSVNGARIQEPQVLKDGDVVRFGELEFIYKQLS